MNAQRRLIIAASLAAPRMPLVAQSPDSTRLPAVVVTATRLESTLGTGISSVTVIDAAALRSTGASDVADALRFVPGVAVVRSGGPGATTSLFLRGGESDYVRVLVDGVAVNDPGGSVELTSLTLDNVDRIEVVRGPTSVLYGTDAVTGVVQIFTKRASAAREIEATATTGSYGALGGDLSLGVTGARVAASLAAARRTSDGILAFNNNYRNDVLSGRLSASPGRDARLTVTARQHHDEYHYPTDGAGAVVDRNALRVDRRSTVGFSADGPIGRRLRAAMSLSLLEGRGRTDDAPDGAADTLGLYVYRNAGSLRRRTADAHVDVLPTTSTALTLGGEWIAEAQRSTDSSNYGATPNRFAAERQNRAVYAQLLAEQGPLSLTFGGRYDDNDVFGDFRTARAGLALRAWRGGAIRGSFGTAFKAPTFLEQFNTAFSVGNRDLRPERSRSVEAGVTQALAAERVTLGITWFSQRFRDLIQYTFVDPVQPNYFNVADATARGLELEARARLSRRVTASANATLLRTRVADAGFDTGEGATFVLGNRLLRRPSRTATLQLSTFPSARTTVDATLLYVGSREDRDFSSFPATPVVLQSYSRLDVGAERVVLRSAHGSSLSLLARAQNLFGAGYAEVANFPAPGRTISVGLRARARR